jgi:hypothetical protein
MKPLGIIMTHLIIKKKPKLTTKELHMNKSLAETFDSYVNWLVLFVFLTAVNLVMEASAFLVSEPLAEALRNWARWVTHAGTLTVIIAIIIWFRRPKEQRKCRDQRALLGGFVVDAARRAAFLAFSITFIVVALLDGITNHTQLPADFFIKLPGISLSAVFSISFFLFTRNKGDDDEGGEE